MINALEKNEEFVDMITFGGFFDEEKFLSDCEQGVLTAGQMINDLVDIKCICPFIKKNYLGKIINSILGVKALQLTMMVFLKNDVEIAQETAEILETWLEEYCGIWRQDNKESELSCIIDYIRKGSKYLRKLQKTSIGLKGR